MLQGGPYGFLLRSNRARILSLKNVDLFSSVFKKAIPSNTFPTFQEVGGVTQPHILCRSYNNMSWYRDILHKLD